MKSLKMRNKQRMSDSKNLKDPKVIKVFMYWKSMEQASQTITKLKNRNIYKKHPSHFLLYNLKLKVIKLLKTKRKSWKSNFKRKRMKKLNFKKFRLKSKPRIRKRQILRLLPPQRRKFYKIKLKNKRRSSHRKNKSKKLKSLIIRKLRVLINS